MISWKLFLKIIASLILIGLIVWRMGGLGEVVAVMAGIDAVCAPLILLVITLDRALMTFKWEWLLRGRGMYLSFFMGMKIYCASMVWGIFLPATLGADAIRALSTSLTGLDSNEVVASIIIERMVGFLSALLFGLLGLVLLSLLGNLDGRFNIVWWFGTAMLVGTITAFCTSFSQRAFEFLHNHLLRRFRDTRIMRRLRDFHSIYLTYRNNKCRLAAFFGLTLSEQLMSILATWLIAWGLGVNISPLYIAGAVPLAFLISQVPISIGGLGVYEGVFMLIISLAGVLPSQAIAITLVGRVLEILAWLPWWLAYVVGNRERGLRGLFAEENRSRPLVGD